MKNFLIIWITFLSLGVSCSQSLDEEPVTERHMDFRLLEMRSGTPTGRISSDKPGRLDVRISDIIGKPQSGQLVKFTTTIGSLFPPSGTALTDKDGRAFVYILAGKEPGAGEAKAESGSLKASVKFSTYGDQPEKKVLTLRLVAHSTGVTTSSVKADRPGRLEATVTNENGDGIPDQIIHFQTTLGDLYPASGAAMTNEYGYAWVLLLTGTEYGDGEAIASTEEYWKVINFVCEGDKPRDVILSTQLLNDDTGTPINEISPEITARIEAVLTDRDGVPIPDQIIEFRTTMGILFPTEAEVLTNLDGKAEILLVSDLQEGEGEVSVLYEETTATVEFISVGEAF